MLRKTRKDDRLSNLDQASRSRLDHWLKSESYRDVVRLAALPPPEGLGLTTNIRALSVYYRKFVGPHPFQHILDLAKSDPRGAAQLASAMLSVSSYQAAMNPSFNITRLKGILELRSFAIDEQRRLSQTPARLSKRAVTR